MKKRDFTSKAVLAAIACTACVSMSAQQKSIHNLKK